MKIIVNPTKDHWSQIATRPVQEQADLEEKVNGIFEKVKSQGDLAIKNLTLQFDGCDLNVLEVSADEITAAENQLEESLKTAILQASQNIRSFHQLQIRDTLVVETMPGVVCKRMARPIQDVGLYIPGGSAPLFSTVLMLAIPAKLAGCRNIILCSPPDKNGNIHPAILYAAKHTGVTRIFKVGGAQAIAALTYGTASVPKVDKIFGPGNQYVTAAKLIAARKGTGIDLPAGPSEVLVIADEQANPDFVAADLLSQAEHGADSQVVLVTTSSTLVEKTLASLESQLEVLPRKEITKQALEKSWALVFTDLQTGMDFSNFYAPEHLIINTSEPNNMLSGVMNAGSVFLGSFTPESAGDYASGTNHTLPTNGYAKIYGGVSVDSFTKYITVQEISAEGLKTIGPVVEKMAQAESLEAHRQAVSIRLKSLS